MVDPPRDAVNEVADRLFDAIQRSDAAAVEAMWADDVLVWHSGDRRDNERARALRVICWFIDHTTQRRYEILDRRVFDGGFVQQHVLHAVGTNGNSIAMRVCIVIVVRGDGLIARIDEYFDPADMAPLLGDTPESDSETVK
ncbi:nuclear transport factor 2 family protein [Mycolicibacterium sp. S2-37]|uniref:nuclear transport factor 2 family protein n=1 Tax=Mycolicibacterium sp. S2-37 TaxID=2810297 RepID=UPI001A94337B|nr:nuclear transport factor 2 family protein [Mycolicibacterium sp. S2-37]MBO0677528.1 nuclear transport factor 2 family protein [Mycolicibacterium sp. S2-37]